MNSGVLLAAAAYTLWGLFPIYIKSLQAVPPAEILAHRMLWSLAFVALLLVLRRHWRWLREVAARPAVLARFAGSAAFVSINWGVYIWAINSDRVVDASLGYFINPLVNVLVGSLLLRERLRPVQWMAVACAAAGVLWLTWQAGAVPWIGLVLALSFAAYGLLRKTATLGALEGLALETALLFPFAFAYLAWLAAEGVNAFVGAPAVTQWLLAAAGPVTAIPLLLFAAGARRISFSLLGLLQYIGPSIQLLLGVWLYHEPFPAAKAAGYALIWAALAIYTAESLWQGWRRPAATTPNN
ncbi:MAG TPA: EamA family transporter RarD [Burkholderiaceae bacterium]|jgi:chloramphenicol-sensitive protein RarD|nr:EamA family transporter RarD [Burkholderiaceae bacterium]